jgi:hypothetical protein
MSLEAEATGIWNFEPLVVPGLLQTAEYATALIHGINTELSESEVNALVATRMARQTLLTKRNAPSLHAIIDEMVLRRPISPAGVMQRQLQHLRSCAQRPNITLQVVPFSAGVPLALGGPIVIIDLADGRSVVHLESRRTAAFLSEGPHVGALKLAMRRLHALATAPDESCRLIATIEGEMT